MHYIVEGRHAKQFQTEPVHSAKKVTDSRLITTSAAVSSPGL